MHEPLKSFDFEPFYQSEKNRILKRYGKKHEGFGSKQHTAEWYVMQVKLQGCKCYYCNTSIQDINRLIDSGKLRVRKVKGDGTRGKSLEIDKMVNGKGYQPPNCVLACYYCNNDKSYTIDGEEYKIHFGPNREK